MASASPLVTLLICLLGSGLAGFAPSLAAAQQRVWFGNGDGEHWSDPLNWIPVGVPESGDDLLFEKSGLTTPTDIENDLLGLSVHSMRFKSSFQFNQFTTSWRVRGREFTVTAVITCDAVSRDLEVVFRAPLRLSNSIPIRALSVGDIVEVRLDNVLFLNGHTLELVNESFEGTFFVDSLILDRGNLRCVNKETENSARPALAIFGPSSILDNTWEGALTVERVPGARPFNLRLANPDSYAVKTRLEIGDGCEVLVEDVDQIGDDAVVSITGGGRLVLTHDETIGSLELANVHADADPTLVDATGTTLTLRGSITTSVFNESGNLPTIKGTLALPAGLHDFDLNNQLPRSPGLDLQAQIVGLGGFSKRGNASLALKTINTFTGLTELHAGTLELQNFYGLGFTDQLTITDGELISHNVEVTNVTLRVRGSKVITANSTGSLVTFLGSGGWVGPIILERDLVVNSTGQSKLGGPILGAGGLELLGARYQLVSRPGEIYRYSFTGPTHVLCELVTVSADTPFHGPLVVGGAFSPTYQIRWENTVNGTVPAVTLDRNAFADLNGRQSSWVEVNFQGGRVSTGPGRLSVSQVNVRPADVTAIIDGNLGLLPGPLAHFDVADGPAGPDLAVNAAISDGNNILGIEKTGDGQMSLHRASTFRGPSVVRAGTLELLHNDALGATAQGTTVASGATVAFGTQVDTTLEPFAIAGLGVGGTAGALRTANDVFLNNDLVLIGAAAIRTEGTNSRIQVNNISGAGPLTKLGSGRLVLRGNAPNTYTGDTLVNEGVLDLAKPNSVVSVPGHLSIGLASAGTVPPLARVDQRASFTIVGSVTVNGGLWDLNGSSEDWSSLDLQGRPPLTLNDGGDVQTGSGIFTLPTGGDIIVNPGSQRFGGSTINGRIGLDAGTHRIRVGQGNAGVLGGVECNIAAALSESGAPADVEKDGDGTLRLGGTNTHRGMTLVTGGTLLVDGVQPQSTARVFDGGRLKGIGTVGHIEMLGATATVAPGAVASALISGAGVLTCSNFNFGAVQDGVLFVELNGPSPGPGYDQINARGTVRLHGLALAGSLGFASPLNQRFTIINNDGADSIQGTFDGLAQDANVFLGGERFTISYTGGTGNDVVLTREVTPHLVATTLPATEVPGFALDFDGRFNRVHVGTNLFPNINNNFTIELWANPTAARTETAEATTGISDLSGQRHAVFPDQGDLGYGASHAGAGLSIGTNGVSVFEHANNHLPSLLVYSNAVPGWTHFALVYSNRQPRLYINGTLARSGLPSAKTVVHPSANLGGSIQGLTYGNFQGQLDEVRIWNAVLSQGQIQTNLNRSLAGTEPGLVLYYRCDETNGATIADSAAASPNVSGVLLNGVASVLSGALPPAALDGPTATLNGLATPDGLDASVWFEWGKTTNYGQVTAAQSVSAVSRAAGFSETLLGLSAGEYQFRAVGSNGLHFSFGLNRSFLLLKGAPVLSIEKLAGDQVRLLWPTSAVGFTLEANADLTTVNWNTASPLPVVNGTNHTVINSTAGRQKFYRLVRP